MNTELFLDNDYVNDLCSEESIQEVLPYLLTLLPVKAIPRTANSNRMVEGLRQDSDSIHAFITKKCVVGEDECVNKGALYKAYLEWCIKEGREGYKKHGFMRNMRARGYVETRRTVPGTGTREVIWKGITLKAFAKAKGDG